MTKRDVSNYLGVSRDTVRDWVNSGRLTPDDGGEFTLQDVEELSFSRFNSPEWLTTYEAGKLLGITRATVATYSQAGLLEKVQLRGRSFVSLTSVKNLLLSKRQEIDEQIGDVMMLLDQNYLESATS